MTRYWPAYVLTKTRQRQRASCLMATLALALAQQNPALADECNKLPHSSVSVRLLESDIQTNHQRSAAALKGMSDRYADPRIAILGLTLGKATASARVATQLLRDPTGRWECASHQVQVEIGYQPITLYVGREFPEGSCAFKEIYQHELRHAQTYRDHARAIVPEIEATLRERFVSKEPTRGPSGSTQARIQSELNDRWLPYIRRLLSAVESQQRDIDTPEEYEKVSKACNGEIQRFMRR